MSGGILELTIIILIAAILGLGARLLHQPLLLAYLLTGFLIGLLGFSHIVDRETFQIFSNLGVMFLLFLVGLEINYRSLRSVGKPSLIVGLAQIFFTALIGYFLAIFLDFSTIKALYIAIALTFSSTIIVVKLLLDKHDLNSLYGKISVGFLLVQDFVAILILIFLSGLNFQGEIPLLKTILMIISGILLFGITFFLGQSFLPKIFDKIARSQELLFLFSLVWLFLVASIVSKIGFSIEIAGFLAGLALANSSERFQIASRISALRDFFIVIFFVLLGASVSISHLSGLLIPIVIFSLFVLIGNPLIVLIIMGLMGYRKRTSFLAGITVAQISEFSLILANLGLKLGHLSQNEVALISSVGIITITLSAYLIIYGDQIFRKISPLLSIFEKKNASEIDFPEEIFQKPIILIGCHRTGESIAAHLPKEKLLIIDFDPDIVKKMSKKGYHVLYGDISDREIFDLANIFQARLVISTSPVLKDNLTLLEEINTYFKDSKMPKPRIVVRAETEEDALVLYENGADYVILPHFTAGKYFGKTITLDPEMRILDELKKNDLLLIKKRNLD